MGNGQAQCLTQGAAGKHGVAEDAVGRHMHALAQAQTQCRIAVIRAGIGQHAQFLSMADQARRVFQLAGGDATALQHLLGRDAAMAEGLHRQRHGVQGGEHALFG